MDTYDVAVIGAGVHGAAAAYHLSRRGARVVLVEKEGSPAAGPTGRSSAICRAYYTNPFLATCARDSIAMFERFEELTGVGAGHRRTGLLYLHPERDADAVRASVARLNGLGIEVELRERDVLDATTPGFDLDGVAVGAYEVAAGYADPHATTEGLVRAAVANGTVTKFGAAVTALEPVASGVEVVTSDGRLAVSRVLLATGPWTKPLAASIGVDLPLTVERHVVATFRWSGVEPVPAHSDTLGGYYFRPEGDDLFLVGPVLPEPQVDPDRFDTSIREDEVERLASAVVRRVPRLEAATFHGGWASLYDVSPDWQPVIGPIADGVYVDAGTSGHGFKLAPALGDHVASMLLDGRVDEALAVFTPERFTSGETLAAGYGDARILG